SRHRREARVAERGADRVLGHVGAQWTRGFQAADAAAQGPVARQRHERRARLPQPRRVEGLRGTKELRFDRRARDGEERVAGFFERYLAARLMQREGRVADHLAFAASGVAGVARGEKPDAELALAREGEKAVERRRAAGLLVIEVARQASDARHRGAIDL